MCFQGTIRYVATGDGLALAYFWIDQNGRIYVRTPLLGVVTSRFDVGVSRSLHILFAPENMQFAAYTHLIRDI